MKKELKTKQIAIKFDSHSYELIKQCAEMEHRGLGSFVRHATLLYVEGKMQNGRLIEDNNGELA